MEKSAQKLQYTQNRELSWLRFNERVLLEATDDNLPLLERLKFVSIFTNNLDEFFMIRVGTLHDLSMIKKDTIDNKSGMTAEEQLFAIFAAVKPLITAKDKIYNSIINELKSYDIYYLKLNELDKKNSKYIKNYYNTQIHPILSPQIIDSHHPFPFLNNKMLYVGTCLKSCLKNSTDTLFGIIPIPNAISEIIYLPDSATKYVLTSDVILYYTEKIFKSYDVVEKCIFSVTRNADINADDEAFDIDDDFRSTMQRLLKCRKRLAAVRLELSCKISSKFLNYFCKQLELSKEQLYVNTSPLKLSYVFSLINRMGGNLRKEVLYSEFTPQLCPEINLNENIFKQIAKRDILLSFPYESMEPFLKLLKEAAFDTSTLSIKISIYRLAHHAKIVDYLCSAAENGKEVTVLIELRARFDEQNNIDWSQKLEESGCHIIYGFEHYKVHSKVCLITKRDRNGISYITQVGTGNYNEKTSTQYTDLSLITSDYEIGNDANEFFKNMAIGNLDGAYSKLIVAPSSMKSSIINLIDREILKGPKGYIFLKVNSISDLQLIKKLQEASLAGVKVKLFVRGICCILPHVEGETDNINIKSIVGRYLEHSRIYIFGSGVDSIMYISSADFMSRNMDRRVEVACPIINRYIKDKINHLIDILDADNTKTRIMRSDGSYRKVVTSNLPFNSHSVLMDEAIKNCKKIPKHNAQNFKFFHKLKKEILSKKS